MDKLVASAQHGQVFVMYDIACTVLCKLVGTLKVLASSTCSN